MQHRIHGRQEPVLRRLRRDTLACIAAVAQPRSAETGTPGLIHVLGSLLAIVVTILECDQHIRTRISGGSAMSQRADDAQALERCQAALASEIAASAEAHKNPISWSDFDETEAAAPGSPAHRSFDRERWDYGMGTLDPQPAAHPAAEPPPQ